MNHIARLLLSAAGALGALVHLGSPSAVLAADQPADWVPENAAVYLGVTDCDALVAAAKKTSTWRVINDPALEKMLAPWKEFAGKLEKLVAAQLGLESPKQLRVYPRGGLALFVVLSPPTGPDDEGDVHLGLIMEMGENREAMQRLTRAVVAKALENKAQRSTREVAGAEITTLRFTPTEPIDEADTDGAPGAADATHEEFHDLIDELPLDEMLKTVLNDAFDKLEPPEELAFTFAGSKLVLALDTETVVQTVRRLKKGREASLAASPAMATLRRHCEPRAQIQVVVNLPLIFELMAKEDPAEAKTLRGLGLKGLGPAVLTYEVAPGDDLDGRVRGFLEIKGQRSGVPKLLLMANTPTAPASIIGADTAVYGSINLDPAEILAEVLQIAARIDPEKGEAMQGGLKVPQADGSVLDVQKDVVDHLSGPLLGMLTLAKPYDDDHINAMIALGHRSRAGVEKLLALIPPGFVVSREMMGSMIYESPMIPIQGLAVALTDRVLIPLGTKGAIESYIRAQERKDGGLADDPDFRRIARLMPKRSCAVIYANGRALCDAQLAIHRAADLPEQPPMFAPVGTLLRWMLIQQFIGKDVPDPTALRKHMGLSMMTLSSESDGLRLDVIGLIPPTSGSDSRR